MSLADNKAGLGLHEDQSAWGEEVTPREPKAVVPKRFQVLTKDVKQLAEGGWQKKTEGDRRNADERRGPLGTMMTVAMGGWDEWP